jgi:hypothetical protein
MVETLTDANKNGGAVMHFLLSVFVAAYSRKSGPHRAAHHYLSKSNGTVPDLISQKKKRKMKYRHVIAALAVSAAATFGPAYGQTTQGDSVGDAEANFELIMKDGVIYKNTIE